MRLAPGLVLTYSSDAHGLSYTNIATPSARFQELLSAG